MVAISCTAPVLLWYSSSFYHALVIAASNSASDPAVQYSSARFSSLVASTLKYGSYAGKVG